MVAVLSGYHLSHMSYKGWKSPSLSFKSDVFLKTTVGFVLFSTGSSMKYFCCLILKIIYHVPSTTAWGKVCQTNGFCGTRNDDCIRCTDVKDELHHSPYWSGDAQIVPYKLYYNKFTILALSQLYLSNYIIIILQ